MLFAQSPLTSAVIRFMMMTLWNIFFTSWIVMKFHEYVVLEITEGILFEESKQTKKIFNRLVEAGIQLHLDDFGTGYSSFSYLPYIPLNTVKMDKSLIDHFLPNNGDVIRNLIDIVHDLGKVVIVEGVEDEWQYEKLLEYQCDIIQGYLFGGPLQAGEIP